MKSSLRKGTIEILKENGFDLVQVDQFKIELWLYGEHVGNLGRMQMFLTKYFPSLKNEDVYETPRTSFKFYVDYDHSVIRRLIKELKESPKKIEKDLRKYKVEKVKQYFRRRTTAV